MSKRLTRTFFRRDPVALARSLLGQRLVRVLGGQRLAGLIVETEAYLGIPDAAAHTYKGRHTIRNQTMWGDGGHCYVYFTYGMHHCANVVAGRAGDPVAVLMRALEPSEGLETMRALRRRDRDLCSGPARLCQALAIDRTLDGTDLVKSDQLFIELMARSTKLRIVTAPRVGVSYAGLWAKRRLRYYIRDHTCVSKP